MTSRLQLQRRLAAVEAKSGTRTQRRVIRAMGSIEGVHALLRERGIDPDDLELTIVHRVFVEPDGSESADQGLPQLLEDFPKQGASAGSARADHHEDMRNGRH